MNTDKEKISWQIFYEELLRSVEKKRWREDKRRPVGSLFSKDFVVSRNIKLFK